MAVESKLAPPKESQIHVKLCRKIFTDGFVLYAIPAAKKLQKRSLCDHLKLYIQLLYLAK